MLRVEPSESFHQRYFPILIIQIVHDQKFLKVTYSSTLKPCETEADLLLNEFRKARPFSISQER